MNRSCYTTVCEKCKNRGEKKRFFNKYACTINKKATSNSCYYFECIGIKDSVMCKHCIDFIENKIKNKNEGE